MTENPTQPTYKHRDVLCTHSENLAELLTELRLTVLISTYQMGHLVVVAARDGKLVLTFHQFSRAMGIAVKPDTIAVCTKEEVWFLRSAPDIAAKLQPRGVYDACFMARTAHFTGDLLTHETAWVGKDLWLVNTSFSCLATLHPLYSFAPRWRPPFITSLAPEDRCHLNGLALVDGQPKYVTALSETDTQVGWREVKASSGCIIDVPSGQTILRGLALPHSPRFDGGKVFFLNSGHGRLEVLYPASGKIDSVADLQGVSRGMALHGGYAFIGLSKSRLSLEGLPIVAQRDRLKCGLTIVDLKTGQEAAHLWFHKSVEELFDIQVLPGITFPYISGPGAVRDAGQPLWTIPPK